jgi:hypothetical protein
VPSIKQIDVQRGVSVPAGAGGLVFDPALYTNVGGVATLTAPDIVIPVPKEAAASGCSETALGTGNQKIVQNNVGAITFDVLSIAFHTIQKVVTGNEKALYLAAATSIAAAGTAIDPLLKQAGTLVAPDIVIPVAKVVPTLASKVPYVSTVLATGAITVLSGEAGAIANDICMLRMHTIQRLIAQVFGGDQDRRRYMTIGNGNDAAAGETYYNNADASQQFEVMITKVSGDGSLTLTVRQIAGSSGPAASGTLNRLVGSGSLTIAWTAVLFEKYADLRQNTAVANGAGLTFDPGLVVNGVRVMPDIVIPVPKAAATVPYVPTDLAGAVGTVNIRHNDGAPQNHDILSLKVVTGFRNVNSLP